MQAHPNDPRQLVLFVRGMTEKMGKKNTIVLKSKSVQERDKWIKVKACEPFLLIAFLSV